MARVPVISKDGKPLMPTKPSRARRWIKEGKAIGKFNDLDIFYVLFILLLASSSPIRRIFTSSAPIILSSKGLYCASRTHTPELQKHSKMV